MKALKDFFGRQLVRGATLEECPTGFVGDLKGEWVYSVGNSGAPGMIDLQILLEGKKEPLTVLSLGTTTPLWVATEGVMTLVEALNEAKGFRNAEVLRFLQTHSATR